MLKFIVHLYEIISVTSTGYLIRLVAPINKNKKTLSDVVCKKKRKMLYRYIHIIKIYVNFLSCKSFQLFLLYFLPSFFPSFFCFLFFLLTIKQLTSVILVTNILQKKKKAVFIGTNKKKKIFFHTNITIIIGKTTSFDVTKTAKAKKKKL